MRLRPQSARALRLLLSQPGEQITREELRQHLWGDETFVDFETAINTCIRRLREALKESAGEPRFIRTLPGQGYLFIASTSIDDVQSRATESPASRLEKTAIEPTSGPVKRHRYLSGRTAGLAILVKVLAFITVLPLALGLLRARPLPVPPVQHTEPMDDAREHLIVLGTPQISGLAPELGGAVSEAFRIGLEQFPGIRVLSPERLRSTMKRMTLPADTPVSRRLGLEVGQREGAASVLLTKVYRFGDEILLEAEMVDPAEGTTQVVSRTRCRGEDQLIPALEQLIRQISHDLGASAVDLRKPAARLQRVTTPSLEALKAYSKANEKIWDDQQEAAESLLRHALELDSDFSMAQIRLALLLRNTGRTAEAIHRLRAASGGEHPLSRFERLYARAWLHSLEGNVGEALETWLLLRELYPNEAMGYRNYALLRASFQGDYLGCANLLEEALTKPLSPPEADDLRHTLVYCRVGANQIAEAVETAAVLKTRHELSQQDYLLWIALGESGELEELMAQWQKDLRGSWSPGDTYLARGVLQASSGDLQGSLVTFRRARKAYLGQGDRFGQRWTRFAVLALLDALGRKAELREEIGAAAATPDFPVEPEPWAASRGLSPARSAVSRQKAWALFGVLAARAGDLQRARAALQQIVPRQESSQPGQLWDAHRALLVAEVEAAEGDIGAAAHTLQEGLATSAVFPLHARARLATWLHSLGQHEEAAPLDRWVTQNPGRALAECLDFSTCLDRPFNLLAISTGGKQQPAAP